MAYHRLKDIDDVQMHTSWCSGNMQVTRNSSNSKAEFDPDVFQIRTDTWMDYIASYTEWELNESNERIFRKSARTNGTFRIPPNFVFY